LRAPAFHYIRLLRISWEVIKTIDPEAYVAVGGLGFPSFMDVVLRNTDNPEEGKVTEDYPLKGGAYFDMMSFHSYPHIDGSMREWSDEVGGFVYSRHSDAAVEGMLNRKREFAEVLANHGYDGNQYPEKVYIITECNLPRKAFSDFIGTEESQRNFIIKALVESQLNNIHQFHIYNMAEVRPYEEAKSEYDLMGLYQKLEQVPPYQQTINTVGITYRTTSEFLRDFRYDEAQTKALQLPHFIRGGAFGNATGEYRYVLWARTQEDRSEEATALFQFPTAWNIKGYLQHHWDYSDHGESTYQEGAKIQLNGQPLFIRPTDQKPLKNDIQFNCSPDSFVDHFDISIYLPTSEKVNLSVWDHRGKLVHRFADGEQWPAGQKDLRFEKTVPPGLYICRLETTQRTLINRLVKMDKP